MMQLFEGKPGPDQALEILRAGNDRFVNEAMTFPRLDRSRRLLAVSCDQRDYAFATIISCSDSRVPVEALFDAGIMDLFVVRVAGNVCGEDELGSVEYGVVHVNTPLVVVLGHTQCGAVTAVTRHVLGIGGAPEKNIRPIAARIEPAVRKVIHENPDAAQDEVISLAVEENVRRVVNQIAEESPMIRHFVRSGGTRVVGALYTLSTGRVDFL